MNHSKTYASASNTDNLYKLVPVSQFRIQTSIEQKKKTKGQKKSKIDRDIDWDQFETSLGESDDRSNFYVESKEGSGRSSERNQQNIKPPKMNDKLIKQSIEDARVSNFYFKKFMAIEYICLILTLLSFFINLVYTEAEEGKQLDLILIATTILTGTLICVIVIRYYYHLELQKYQKILKYSGNFLTKLHKSGNLFPMIIQIIIITIHPNILFKDVQITQLEAFSLYTIVHECNDLLALFLLLRVYIILRGMVFETIFSSPRASRLCRIHLCDHNIMFSVKCILKQYPLRALVIIFFLLLFIFGHGIKLCESPLALVQNPMAMDFTNYLNCLWCIIVTMGTIGYGDYYPRTVPGRIVLFLTSICGVLLSSLLIVALSAYLNMTTEENKAHICIKRLKLQDIVSKQAAEAMIAVVKLGQYNKESENLDNPAEQKKFDGVYQSLKQHTSNVKSRMRQIKSLVDNNNLYQQMQRYFTILKNNFNQIFRRQLSIKTLLMQIANMSNSQELNVISFAKTLQQKALKND